jgi:hypothetical protein
LQQNLPTADITFKRGSKLISFLLSWAP